MAAPSAGGVIELMLKLVVTPSGAPETLRATGELKALIDVTVMVDVSEFP